MGRPLRVEYPGALYHVTSRGNERRNIFLSGTDRKIFLGLLRDSHERLGVLLHSYVLMDNHYHLVLETPRANLVKAMHGINCSYTRYFNRRHKRVGHLFQGRYNAILVDREAYLLELSRYVHLNPVRAGFVRQPGEYRWSSYRSFVGAAPKEAWLECSWVLSRFGLKRKEAEIGYRRFVEGNIAKMDWSLSGRLFAGLILGSEPFVQEVKGRIVGEGLDREIVERRKLRTWSEPDKIINEVALAFDAEPASITARGGRDNLARKVAILLTKRYGGLSNQETGRLFGGLSGSAISRAAAVLGKKANKDRGLRGAIERLESRIKT